MSETSIKKKSGSKKKRWILGIVLLLVVVLLVFLLSLPSIIVKVGKYFTAQEDRVRSDWTFEYGEVLEEEEAYEVLVADASLETDLTVLRLVPEEIEEESFTYYDTQVQERLAATLKVLQEENTADYTLEEPLAVLNPYGTGSNGLYLYFYTEEESQVRYTIETEGEEASVYTALAQDSSGQEYTYEHEFQMIGLVPGEMNVVTLEILNSAEEVIQTTSFSIEMPETLSGYSTQLSYTEGESSEELSEGLYALMRTNGYLGYGFFFDNEGILRYEMVLEGFGLDRLIDLEDGTFLTCVSSKKIARMDGLGRVLSVYELDGYRLHHDIGLGEEGELLILAEQEDAMDVEDRVLRIDLETGEVEELLDFTQLLDEYYGIETRAVTIRDQFFWQTGEEDWIHLNTLQYLAEDDSLIVSSRETSTIIKVKDVHGEPTLTWFVGDSEIWADTAYADLSLKQEGDFLVQYGQHAVEYAGEGEEEGIYYLYLFNNNYCTFNSRDLELDLTEGVNENLYGEGKYGSYVYLYRIDENAGTFSLADSFAVPYSSIVSNAALAGDSDHWVVNSGISQVFGEYDSSGELIREFNYKCNMQGYRTFKFTMEGIWFSK